MKIQDKKIANKAAAQLRAETGRDYTISTGPGGYTIQVIDQISEEEQNG